MFYEMYISPVSPVFHTVVTVRIGLKTQLQQKHPFYSKTYVEKALYAWVKNINFIKIPQLFNLTQNKNFQNLLQMVKVWMMHYEVEI